MRTPPLAKKLAALPLMDLIPHAGQLIPVYVPEETRVETLLDMARAVGMRVRYVGGRIEVTE